ncbi:MAG: PhoPQ-activated pathogenicity-related family protein [Candidatus Polarisedimenticolia bacterium]
MKRQPTARFAAALMPPVLLVLLVPACAATGPPRPGPREDATPLDRYVAAVDPAYDWEPVHDLRGEGCVAHVLKLTSQTWLAPGDVDRTVWWHWLTIVEPETITSDIALLYIHSGGNDDAPPDTIRSTYARIASSTGTVVAELRMVPNQPLRFAGDPGSPRREDRLIAYAWDRFLRGGNPVWLPRLPMTKSVVRAMDTVAAYFEKRGAGGPRVGRFVVAGASKRGWTTWTTAAVDDRVVAIIPMVIDLLNLEASFRHHFDAYGFWAPAIASYVEMGIPGWLGTPEMRRLREIVDPYEYRARLTMPKLILNATGDQFFVPDSSRLYFDDLPGEKHLRYVPNADHSMRKTDVDGTVLAFYRSIVTGAPRPEFTWTFEPDGSIRVRTGGSMRPAEARLWQAANPSARDFRLETLGPAWRGTVIALQPDGDYVARAARPVSGWTAFLVELTYGSGDTPPLKLTTEIRVLPGG